MSPPTPQPLIHVGHILHQLHELPPKSVHCIVTSPPYYDARVYKGPEHFWPDGWTGQLGQEKHSSQYITHLDYIFVEMARVLRDDGVLFFNIADSHRNGLPLHIPEYILEVAEDSGWYCKSKIVWAKGCSFKVRDLLDDEGDYIGAVMPEPVDGWRWVQHRVPANTPEAAAYEAELKALMVETGKDRNSASVSLASKRPPLRKDCPGCDTCTPNEGLVFRCGSWRPTHAYETVFMFTKQKTGYFCDRDAAAEEHRYGEKGGACIGKQLEGAPPSARSMEPEQRAHKGGRNARDVWVIPTKGYKGAHFATFPEALVAPCIKVACPEYCCPECGAAYARVRASNSFKTTCPCSVRSVVPGTVLDPFSGSGTTLLVASKLHRRSIGIEACPEYAELAKERCDAEIISDSPDLVGG
jgi:DNA modification methylase